MEPEEQHLQGWHAPGSYVGLDMADLSPEPEPSRRRRGLAWLGAAALLVTVAVVAAVFAGGRATTAEEDVRRALALANELKTAKVEISTTAEYSTGGAGVGGESTTRGTAEGVIELPHRSHMVDRGTYGATETVVTKDGIYYRGGARTADLASATWAFDPAYTAEVAPPGADEGAIDDSSVGSMLLAGQAVGAMGAPARFFDELAHLDAVERVSPGTIRGTIDGKRLVPSKLTESVRELDVSVTVDVSTGDAGTLDRLVIRLVAVDPGDDEVDEPATRTSHTFDMRFTKWGEPVDIDVPSTDELGGQLGPEELHEAADQYDDGYGLGGFDSFPLFVPAELPPGYEISESHVSPQDDSSGVCASVRITWRDANAAAYVNSFWPDLSVTAYQMCEHHDEVPELSRRFETGTSLTVAGHPAVVHAYDDSEVPYRDITFYVDDVKYVVGTQLPEADLLRYGTNLVPLDQ